MGNAYSMHAKDLLRKWLEEHGKTRLWLAERLRKHKSTVTSYFTGRMDPSAMVRTRMSRITKGYVPVETPWLSESDLKLRNQLRGHDTPEA